ncbi:hypothetical protein GJ744_010377 [Endocarpon pusillum]|uniref:Uncharacterized protein n=1 Tax=Endocarpon pusillum TaxID=364733 RepID=A0A8H7E5F5_9EURO|nr:hypothetical protein GJ744_010377 [Endocarpon pusillum]
MRIKDGIFFPMLQREALVLAFSSSKTIDSQFAIRIFTGGINVLTGQSVVQEPSASAEKCQDYVLAPQQGLVSGYKANGSVKQFVAMPMGDKYTVEYQLTGKEFIGGIQLELIPRLRDTVLFERSPSNLDSQKRNISSTLEMFATPRQLGFHPGQRYYMLDSQPRGLYDSVQGEWSQDKDLVEPEKYSSTRVNRPTFVHELFDGPEFARFDPSSSLVITILKPIQMVGEYFYFKNGTAAPTFYCSPLARMSDVRRFLRVRLQAMSPDKDWLSRAEIELKINGTSYNNRDDTLVRDLNLTSPQKIKIGRLLDADWVGADVLLGRAFGVDGGSRAERGPTPPGWDVGIAMGGAIKQTVAEDHSLHI